MLSKGKVLVTGGTGYIGSHTIIELIETTGVEIISVDNYSNSSPATTALIESITGKKIVNHNVDLCNLAATDELFAANPGITGIIHFAAFKSVPESVAHPLTYYHNNIASLVNILQCATKYKVNNFIFSSSCSVYGNIEQLPVTEDTPLPKAESPYANTKQIGEEIIRDYVKVNPSLQAISLRYFNPVGAHPSGRIGESPINPPNNLVPVITQTAVGKIPQLTVFGGDYPTRDGTCIRDYVHVTDIATAHIKALELLVEKKNEDNYLLFNLGTGKGVSVLEAITSFEKISGVKLNYRIGPRRPGDVEAIYSDCTKAEKILGWKPKYDLDDMMETAWKWQQHSMKGHSAHA